jgi:hypothetical protein
MRDDQMDSVIVLLGDAYRPMPPYIAMEDAAVLS